MNKKFFAKYLVIEGEIKEGDKVKYSKGKLGFPNDIYTVLDNEKEKMSAKGIGGFGIYYCKKTYKREDGKTVKEGAYLKIGYNIDLKDIQKVKLFLCSRDIQIGDKECVIFNSDGSFTQHMECEVIRENNYAGFIRPSWGQINSFLKDCFKVIGEISSEATWVKEEDEFDEEELLFFLLDKKFPDNTMVVDELDENKLLLWTNIFLKNRPDRYSIEVQIKGPCGHFH